MSLTELWELVKNREACHTVYNRVAKSQTRLSHWATPTTLGTLATDYVGVSPWQAILYTSLHNNRVSYNSTQFRYYLPWDLTFSGLSPTRHPCLHPTLRYQSQLVNPLVTHSFCLNWIWIRCSRNSLIRFYNLLEWLTQVQMAHQTQKDSLLILSPLYYKKI